MSHRRELLTALVVAWLLILVRSYVFAAYEQSFFDSDQAVIGLMAKHLADGRALPLFFYGQAYLLAVESWVAAPFIWLGGATVPALRSALIAMNLSVATLLIVGLVRTAKLRASHALMATMFFVFAPPLTAGLLVEAQGASIEPFLYVLLAWWWRRRPIALGLVLGVGFLNREFTAYAVPALIVVEWISVGLSRDMVRRWLVTAVAFLVIWDGVNALKPYVDLLGPGTKGSMLGGYPGSNLENLAGRAQPSVAKLAPRLTETATRYLPMLIGGGHVDTAIAKQGRNVLRWPIAGALLLMGLAGGIAAVSQFRRDARVRERLLFPAYLTAVGTIALIAFAGSRDPTTDTLRYLLLTLLVPIGMSAIIFALDGVPRLRLLASALAVTVVLSSSMDHASLIRLYVSGCVWNPYRDVVNALLEKKVTLARADYWTAYRLTFLSGERIKIASTDFLRIGEYQDLVDASPTPVPVIQQTPCAGASERIGTFYLCQ